MQNDQSTGSADSPAKDAGSQSDNSSELTLSGSSSATQSPAPVSDSIPDPAEEALAAKQSEPASDPASSASEESVPTSPPTEDAPPPETTSSSPVNPLPQNDDTLDPIKKEALQKLEPLVSELDLNPEEKYRALMMIIQATDNKELVNEAFQAADKIEDNKTRAQALLSIINEIEYFKNKEKV